MAAEDGWVEVITRHRLWSFVPDEERITEEKIHTVRGLGSDRDGVVDRLRNPQCEIAVKIQGRGAAGLWMPCAWPTAEGATRCAKHGGPKRTLNNPTTTALLADNMALRAELDRQRDRNSA